MKILFVTAHLGGGAGKAISGIALECSKQNETRVMVLEPARDFKYVNNLISNHVQIVKGYKNEIQREICIDSDIIIFNWWNHPISHIFLKNIDDINCRIIIWNHINGCSYPYLPFIFLNEFDYIFFTTKYSLQNELWEDTEKQYIKEKSCTIYGMGNFDPSNMKYKQDYTEKESFVVGYVGTLNYAKMCPSYMEYCIAAVNAIPNIVFLLVGEPDQALLRDIENSDISSHFELTGYVQNPEKYYLEMDVFGYLLKDCTYATTENSLLEAMAYGLPIIVLNQRVEREIILQNKNGFLIDNSSMYSETLYQLYKDNKKREEIGRKARNYVCLNYSKEVNYNNLNQVCENLMNYEKKFHHFKSILGTTPYEGFCFFTGKDACEFKKIVEGKNYDMEKLRGTYKVYTGESKSSIKQFCKYFPDDKNLHTLLSWLEQ